MSRIKYYDTTVLDSAVHDLRLLHEAIAGCTRQSSKEAAFVCVKKGKAIMKRNSVLLFFAKGAHLPSALAKHHGDNGPRPTTIASLRLCCSKKVAPGVVSDTPWEHQYDTKKFARGGRLTPSKRTMQQQ